MAGATLALAVLAISWGSILVRLCVSPPLTLAFLRVFLAALMIAPAARSGGRAPSPRRGGAGGAAGAGMFLALHFGAWVTSLSYTSIAASTLLVSTQPLFSVALSMLFLRERPRGRTLVGIALAMGGIAWIAAADLRSGPGRFAGDLLALAGAVFAAAYLVVGRAVRDRLPLPLYLTQVNLWAALACALMALALRQPLWPATGADLGFSLLMALVPHLLGHGALNWAVRRQRAYVASLAVLGEPVLASLYAFVLFDEAPTASIFAGAALIGSGVALALGEAAGDGAPPRGL